jgi:hypothetical protein
MNNEHIFPAVLGGSEDASGSIILDPFQKVLNTENTALKPVLWIHTMVSMWIPIRIQNFLSMRIRIRIQIQGLDDQILEKFTAKKNLNFLKTKLHFTYP